MTRARPSRWSTARTRTAPAIPTVAATPVLAASPALAATLAVVVAAALGLTACSTGTSPAPAGDGAGTTATPPEARTLTVLAAASLTDVLELVAADVEADHPGLTVEQSFAASSTIVQQVNEGAPADVIALAGESPLEALDDDLRVSDPVAFATNTLQIAVPPDNPAGIGGLEDLRADGIRLVVCEPQVPCGAATATLLARLSPTLAIASYEQDVRAALAKVELGEADAAVVYRTDVIAAGDRVRGVAIPDAVNVVNTYPVLAVSDSPDAQVFIDELLSERGQRHLADAGFRAP